MTDEGLKGFRDVIAEAEALGDATAQGAKTAREAFAATPPSGPAFDRLEPRVEPEGLRTPPRPPSRPVDQPRTPAAASPFDAPAPEPRVAEPERPVEPRPGQQRQSPMRQPSADDIGELPKHSRVGLVAAIVTVVLILALGAAAYWQRDRIAGLLNAVRGPVTAAKGRGRRQAEDHRPCRPAVRAGLRHARDEHPDRRGRRGRATRRAVRRGPGRPAGQALRRHGDLAHRDGHTRARARRPISRCAPTSKFPSAASP